MKLLAFKVENFRSILDSGWVTFSKDGVTVFVGQNESGKSTLLEALNCALSNDNPTDDDFRVGSPGPGPEVRLKVSIKYEEIQDDLSEYSIVERAILDQYLAKDGGCIEIICAWKHATGSSNNDIHCDIRMGDDKLEKLLKTRSLANSAYELAAFKDTAELLPSLVQGEQILDAEPATGKLNGEALANHIWASLPLSVLFKEATGRLPSVVDIDENGKLEGEGVFAAENFLRVANIELSTLLVMERRARKNLLERANAKVSDDFNSFWTQTIGKSGRLELKCEFEHYDHSHGAKAGRPHLIFWICDGQTRLYPKQRSQGVVWFVSFYLQLKASEQRGIPRIFLLDEPGANLHARAQRDVLGFIDNLSKSTAAVVYATHSPELLDYSKLYRVHAVQRDTEASDNPTIVIDAHRLGTASSDTLSPILNAMGVDLSSQQVIRKSNNVLLEEMSGYYYLSAFWHLLDLKNEVHFIAATGVGKVEPLANMFVGWGLHFIVAIDDDQHGRAVYNALRRNIFGDDEEVAKQRLLKLGSGAGIEDTFAAIDFKRHVLGDDDVTIDDTNSVWLKRAGRSKPVLAYQFFMRVKQGELKLADFEQATQETMYKITQQISNRLLG